MFSILCLNFPEVCVLLGLQTFSLLNDICSWLISQLDYTSKLLSSFLRRLLKNHADSFSSRFSWGCSNVVLAPSVYMYILSLCLGWVFCKVMSLCSFMHFTLIFLPNFNFSITNISVLFLIYFDKLVVEVYLSQSCLFFVTLTDKLFFFWGKTKVIFALKWFLINEYTLPKLWWKHAKHLSLNSSDSMASSNFLRYCVISQKCLKIINSSSIIVQTSQCSILCNVSDFFPYNNAQSSLKNIWCNLHTKR